MRRPRPQRSFVKKEKPTPFYHMATVDYITNKGWKVSKHDTFLDEKGTFLIKDNETLFVGWSGKVVFL
jgi:hypothetical protein